MENSTKILTKADGYSHLKDLVTYSNTMYERGFPVGLAPPCKAVSCLEARRTYASDIDLMTDYQIWL